MAATREWAHVWQRLQADRRAGIAYLLFICAIILLYPATSEIASRLTWSSAFIRRQTIELSVIGGWLAVLALTLRYIPIAFCMLSVITVAAGVRLNYSALAATWGRVVLWSSAIAALLVVIGFILMAIAWFKDRRSKPLSPREDAE